MKEFRLHTARRQADRHHQHCCRAHQQQNKRWMCESWRLVSIPATQKEGQVSYVLMLLMMSHEELSSQQQDYYRSRRGHSGSSGTQRDRVFCGFLMRSSLSSIFPYYILTLLLVATYVRHSSLATLMVAC